jgi:hypothetical protein
MREYARAVAFSIACLAAAMAFLSNGEALAQAKQQMTPAQGAPPAGQRPALKQMALTEKQAEAVLAQKDMDAITDKLLDDA